MFEWPPYVSVAERRRKAQKKIKELQKKGRILSPVVIEGRTIAASFWGKSWCKNLEAYSDYASRLPRGRSYARNGSVLDLQIKAGKVTALVNGSSFYDVEVNITKVRQPIWEAICADCTGAIDSLVELLQGHLSKAVMDRICQVQGGLFPSPDEIEFRCSCPDSAYMCKHVAAVLYGIGARLDHQPEMLFQLRQANELELVDQAGKNLPLSKVSPDSARVLHDAEMADLFGLDLDDGARHEESLIADKNAFKKKAAKKKKAVAKKKPAVKKKKVAATIKKKPAAKKKVVAKKKSAAKKKKAVAKKKSKISNKAAKRK